MLPLGSLPGAVASGFAPTVLQAVTARLNALENDNTVVEEVAAASDDEFDVDEESEEERSSDDEDVRLGCAVSVRRSPLAMGQSQSRSHPLSCALIWLHASPHCAYTTVPVLATTAAEREILHVDCINPLRAAMPHHRGRHCPSAPTWLCGLSQEGPEEAEEGQAQRLEQAAGQAEDARHGG